mgnify:CR=1 FL=1
MDEVHPQRSADTEAERVFGIEKFDWERRVVVQRCVPQVLDDNGALPSGALCLLIDHTVGSTISTHLEHHERMVTSHMHIEFLHPLRPGLEALVGQCTALDLVPGSAFASGTASTPGGLLIARFSARFALFSSGEQGGGVVNDAVPVEQPLSAPAPHEWTTSPVHQILGTEVLQVADGRVRLTMRATRELSNERDGVHGGAGGVMGDRAGELALRTLAGPNHTYRPAETRVLFVRPIAASGAAINVDAEVTFFGRTTATTTARVWRPDGKLAIQVDAVHLQQLG